MTATIIDPKRPLAHLPDEEIENRYNSIRHSIVQAAGGIEFWQAELIPLRHERKERAARAQSVQVDVKEPVRES